MKFKLDLAERSKANNFIRWADANGLHHNWHWHLPDSGYIVEIDTDCERQAILIMLMWS